MPDRTYFWDFFGPRAEGTATHFVVHLDEFLAREGLDGCTTGRVSQGRGHHAATCRAPERHWPALERALRPKRWEEGV